ncbi:hypothetical protein CLV36_106220 [Laceyella sediminis]|uniref:Uncharacterized protein n=1 Tax=Laceyella sediminis TaxID=573074 RepID=A0ABX5EP42_9BACL|nr:hypothetical protein [Laceyella sediminis]PRZ14456.1 hypothetical protein CLV36_106220 [Laceyella sediminis]
MAKWEAVKQPATDEDIQRIEAFVGQRLRRFIAFWFSSNLVL